MSLRVYCNGKLTREKQRKFVAAYLDDGLVCTDYVPGGQNGNDVAYFREGTADEIASCRKCWQTPMYKVREVPPKDEAENRVFEVGWDNGRGNFTVKFRAIACDDNGVSLEFYDTWLVKKPRKEFEAYFWGDEFPAFIDALVRAKAAADKRECRERRQDADGWEHEAKDHNLAMTPKEARAFMKTAEYRVVKNEPQIKYKGKWFDMAREDLCGEVTSGESGTKTPAQWGSYYRRKIIYGVRVKDKSFLIIDQATDG